MSKMSSANALIDLNRVMRSTVERNLPQRNSEGIPPAQMNVLNILLLNGPMRMSELAERTHTTRPNLTMLIERLHKQNYVQRRHSRQDRRRVVIDLTQNAIDNMEEIKNTTAEALGKNLEVLSADELAEIEKYATRLAEMLKKVDESR